MNVDVEKKFAVEVVYNGVEKSFEVQPEERVTALLQKAIATFGITQQPHLLSLFRQNGSVVPEDQSIEAAGVTPREVLLLRPNVVKGGDEPLRLARETIGRTFRIFGECGRGECECAVYWTGPANESLVDRVEHPSHQRSPRGYQVDSDWLTEFWKRLAMTGRSVRAQVHTHPGQAFHSAIDDDWPIVSQAGFLSLVIPDFAMGEPSIETAWVGRLKADGEWEQLPSPAEALILS
jgi:proteasome lid subunit RPN8/RPN11